MKIVQTFFFLILVFQLSNIHAQDFAKGADVGWLSEMEASGRIWRDSLGIQKDLLDILPDYCINSIRLRVWVNPTNGWSGKQDVINLAKRAVDKGYRLMVDFHYSDSWADPGQQTKPTAWENYSIQELEKAIYDHTADVLTALKTEGITPEWVQVGNETNNGMLWPEGRASTNMANYAGFVDSGYEAVKTIFPTAKVIVHVANGYDNELFKWNIGGLVNNGARFDVIAMSMYPDDTKPWQQYTQEALANMQDLIQRYNKPIMVSEIGLATNQAAGAKSLIEQVISDLEALPNNQGLGVFYWEPQAYNWRGYGKVAWSGNSGSNPYQATEAMKGFKVGCEPVNNSAVKVTFKVDMTLANTDNGVFVTGTMTNNEGNWQIIPLNSVESNNYEYSFLLLPGESGAFYFLNNNDWAARETVPSECVEFYASDRGYIVPQNDTIIHVAWSSCESGVVTTISDGIVNRTEIYPNPFKEYLIIHSSEKKHFKLLDIYGVSVEEGEVFSGQRIGQEVNSGTYILQLSSLVETEIIKVIKQ